MDIDTNKDGKVSLDEAATAVAGFMSAATADVLRILTAASSVLVLAATLWNAAHPAAPIAVPTTGPVPVPALPDAPVASPADTDAPAPAPADTDAVKAAQAPAGGGS